jgi:hypothetical protein
LLQYEYQLNESSDVTPHDEDELESVHAYIPDNAIVNLISAVYETSDETWYANNHYIANDYFANLLYPRYAFEQTAWLP